MQAETKQKIQLVLAIILAIVAGRVGYIFYERHLEGLRPAKAQAPPLNPDYYVTPRKLYPYDMKTARQLTEQPVWVQVGYSITYFPYEREHHHSDFAHQAGKLLPLEKLSIKDVVADVAVDAPGVKQVMAVFQKNGKSYAFSVGGVVDGNFKFYGNDMLFIQDPHELYKHWPADIWQAIDQHEVRPGMSEAQADFAIGLGIPEGGQPGERTVDYPNGGKPLSIRYSNGKAVMIKPGA